MSWGGAREGAGRPARGPVPSEPHKTRPLLAARHPVHVIARLVSEHSARSKTHQRARTQRSASAVRDRSVGNAPVAPTPRAPPVDDRPAASRARERPVGKGPPAATTRVGMRAGTRGSLFARSDVYRALRRALALSLARADFRIVHVAVLRGRLELVVEADDKTALARGMQGFQVSAAKWLNRFAQRRGTVFADRYRSRILKTRTDVRALVGSMPAIRTSAWPQTWLLRIELSRTTRSSRAARRHVRRWIRSRTDDDP